MDDIPFDLRALRVIIYDKNAPNWGAILREKIEASLKEILASPAEAVLPAFLDVKSVGQRPTVSPEQKDLIEIKQEIDMLRREIRFRATRSGRDRETDIGPDKALRLISAMIDAKLPTNDIVDNVRHLGPPRQWIEKQIADLKKPELRAVVAEIKLDED